jgi:putative ABC transport system permease protein
LIESFNGLFNEISGKQIHFNVLQPSWLWVALPLLIVVLTLMAGFYPALYLSSFKPIKVLRRAASSEKGSIGLRSGLVVFQFAISLVLIISALVVQQQLGFIQHTDLGFKRDQLLVIHNDGEVKNREREDFKRRISSNSMFQSSSFSTGIPLPGSFHMRSFNLPESNTDQGMNWYEADEDFVPTLDLKLKEGRNFSKVPGADRHKVLINERAAQVLGIIGNAIGQRIIKNQGAEDEAELEVVGVLGDFNFESLRTEIKPLVIEYMVDYFLRDYITVRVNAGTVAAAIEELQQTWKQFEPRVPMNYTFLDQDFEAVYHSEIRIGKLMNVLTLISIFIALLGLFGLTAYSVQQRSKEIGIRKAFGAQTSELFLLLSGSYFKLIGVAVLLAVPTAYLLMGQWLGDFAFRVSLRPWVFLIGAGACFGLALLTVLFQTIKSIGTNPVSILKNE